MPLTREARAQGIQGAGHGLAGDRPARGRVPVRCRSDEPPLSPRRSTRRIRPNVATLERSQVWVEPGVAPWRGGWNRQIPLSQGLARSRRVRTASQDAVPVLTLL